MVFLLDNEFLYLHFFAVVNKKYKK